MYAWVYTAEVTSKRIRERYLKAILRQDIAFFDNIGPGEITTRIQTDTRMCFVFFDSCPRSGYRRRHCINQI
jgi:ABC-type multidrug transport system fused ATPase/permease subunit